MLALLLFVALVCLWWLIVCFGCLGCLLVVVCCVALLIAAVVIWLPCFVYLLFGCALLFLLVWFVGLFHGFVCFVYLLYCL